MSCPRSPRKWLEKGRHRCLLPASSIRERRAPPDLTFVAIHQTSGSSVDSSGHLRGLGVAGKKLFKYFVRYSRRNSNILDVEGDTNPQAAADATSGTNGSVHNA